MSRFSINDSLGFQVNITANALRNRFNDLLKPYGLTSEQYAVLKAIEENPNVTPSRLANILFKDRTTLTRLLATMEANDLLLRVPRADDRRSHRLALSQKAFTLLGEVIPLSDTIIAAMRSRFTEDQLQSFLAMLHELRSIEDLKEETP